MATEIKHEQNEQVGEFYIPDESGERIGKLGYTLDGSGKLIIQHTEVNESLRGTGASTDLIDAVADHARDTDLKIVPVCPFAKKYMIKKRDKYGDVLV